MLITAYLAFRRRYLLAGLALGFGYLVHPAALLSVPALIGIVILRPRNSERYAWIHRVSAIGLGIGVCLVLWRLINQGHYAQDTFLSYFKLTGGLSPPTTANWFRSRIASVLNTLMPLNLIIFHRLSPELQSIYGFAPSVVQFFFLYWDTLPFGAGMAFFVFVLLRLLYAGLRKARSWLIALFVVPFVLFALYWGWGLSGLLREGLHAWFLGLIIFAVVMWHRYLRASGRFFRVCSWALLFRGVEALLVLLLPTIASQHMLVQPPYTLSDTVALASMVTASVALYALTFSFAWRVLPKQGGRDG